MAEHQGDADAALAELPRIAAAAGMDSYAPCHPEEVDRELAAGRHAGARLICFGAPDYPNALSDLSDAPPILWARGDTALLDRPAISIVGARNASSLGRRMAKALSVGLGNSGLVVVSGLARGIDAVAHTAALETGTIAVVAGGVDIVYPRENAELTAKIAETGLILSEMPPGLQPQARHFPRRNRIIAGLSRAVVVVEAAVRSGSLITARDALDQGREVMAVPGHPFDARASGCNILIRDGATLVRGAEDVIDALGTVPLQAMPPKGPSSRTPAAAQPAAELAGAGHPGEARSKQSPLRSAPDDAPAETAADTGAATEPVRDMILNLLGPAPVAEDQLLRDLALPGAEVAEELLALEMDGHVVRQPGGLLALAG